MNLNIKLQSCDLCKLIVEDNSSFVNESNTIHLIGKFKKSEVYFIDVLEKHNLLDKNTLELPYINKDFNTLSLKNDGVYTLYHISLPSEEWKINNPNDFKAYYPYAYYTDGKSIYKNNSNEKVDINEIVNLNTNLTTTISRIELDYVSICFLRKCYLNLCLEIFNLNTNIKCHNKNNIDKELIFKRDIAWMAINTIKYLTECNQLEEVNRIIETIINCNGICLPSITNIKSDGCGCSKK